jgi:exosome complex RNA-binding protein Csl4
MKVYPGKIVGSSSKFLPGKNTYLRGSDIVATVVGTLEFEETGTKGLRRAKVVAKAEAGPEIGIGTVVVCTVLRVEPYFASVKIEGTT